MVRVRADTGKPWKREGDGSNPDTNEGGQYKEPSIKYPVGVVLNPNFGGKLDNPYKFSSLTRESYLRDADYSATIPGGYKLLLTSDKQSIRHTSRVLIKITGFSESKKKVMALDITGRELEPADVIETEGFIDTAIDAIQRATRALNGLERTLDTTRDTFDVDMETYQNTKNEAELYLACVDGLGEVPQLETVIKKLQGPFNGYKEADAKVYHIVFVKPFERGSG